MKMSSELKPSDQTVSARTLEQWSVGRLLRMRHAHVPLREAVRNSPYLDRVTIAEVVASPFSLERFLDECRSMPQCGETQIRRLRMVLQELFTQLAPVADQTAAAAVHAEPDASGDTAAPVAPSGSPDAVSAGIPFLGEFYPDFVAARETVYRRLWRLAHFNWFAYLPSSLPEFAKTPAVMRAELGQDADLDGYIASMGQLRASLTNIRGVSGIVLLDAQPLRDILSRRGRYAGLCDHDIAEQRAQLEQMLAVLPAGIDFRVIDFETARLSSCAVVSDQIVSYMAGGFLVARNHALRGTLIARIEQARQRATPLKDVLAGTKAAIARTPAA